MTKYRFLLLVIVVLILFSSPCLAFDLEKLGYEFSMDSTIEEVWDEWLEPGQYYTMVTQDDEKIMETARRIYVGDQYLTWDNRLYEVINVSDNVAHANFVEEVSLEDEMISISKIRHLLGLSVASAQDNDKSGIIGIYHTHNAESYVPSDGTESIDGKGGIHAVGAAFTETLDKLGVETDYSETLHLPHDRGAYRRSRDTVLEILSHDPDAIFDVHRDAAPEEAYATEMNDSEITRIQFVVGRQNQNLGINRQYAQSLKAVADKIYPGLVKGIFMARGNYNQDLTPLNLLLEVGAHTNTKEAAARGISLFAEVVDYYFYGRPEQRAGGTRKGVSSASKTIFWIMLFIAATGSVFYVINAGGFRAALERLKRR